MTKPSGPRHVSSHRYLPAGEKDRQEMLAAIGVESIERLFDTLPAEIRLPQALDITGPLSDQELRHFFHSLEQKNRVPGRDVVSFLGGGAYRHESPAVTDFLITRSEFLTVYTPYQPEVSQGTLQAIFEFQSLMALLTGLPVANASLYEGASALAEGVLMAQRLQRKRSRVLVARSIHPQYRQTLATYLNHLNLEVVEIPWDARGQVDGEALAAALDEDTSCVAVQSPNYFGVIEDWQRISGPAQAQGALTVGVVSEALSLALLRSPGEGGCDIAVGEAQSFGLPLSYGGPYLGFMAARDKYVRALPGRLAGQTLDADGKRAFVLTLATREQHIRREKATSNICTNQALCALAATIYVSLHGKHGLRRLAEINLQRAAALARRLPAETGLARRFEAPFFNELTVRVPRGAAGGVPGLLEDLEAKGVLAGIPLGKDYPELEDCFLLAVTECNPQSDFDRLIEAVHQS